MKNTTIKYIVHEGYKHLANRSVPLYTEFRKYASSPYIEDIRRLDTVSRNLEMLHKTGDIAKLIDRKRSFADLINMTDMAIPPAFKPNTPEQSLALASTAIRNKRGIKTFDQLMEKAKITSFEITDKQAGVMDVRHSDGKHARIFGVYFDPTRLAYSAMVNLHELIHSLQDEIFHISQTIENLRKIQGITSFFDQINKDKELAALMMKVALESHMLDFLALSQVRHIAKKAGVPDRELDLFLKENIPKVNFLSALTEGEAYVSQVDILGYAPDIASNNVIKASYQTMAMADMFLAVDLPPKQRIYMIGIGLAGFFEQSPQMRNEFLNSPKIIQEFNTAYF